MPSILFVCTANQCRSPMAMVLMRKRLQDRDLKEEWKVGSAGTWGIGGAAATLTAQEAMEERGLSLVDHRSQSVSREVLEEYDLILTMESNHKEGIQIEFPDLAHKVYLLSEMVSGWWDIEDPVGDPIDSYRSTATAVDEILDEGFDRILELANSNIVD